MTINVQAWVHQHRNATIGGAAAGVAGIALLSRRKAKKAAGAGAAVSTTYTPQTTYDTTSADLQGQLQTGLSGLQDQMNQSNNDFAGQLAALRDAGGTSSIVTTPGQGPGASTSGGTTVGPFYPGGTPGGPPRQKLPPGSRLPGTGLIPTPGAVRPSPPAAGPSAHVLHEQHVAEVASDAHAVHAANVAAHPLGKYGG